MDTEKATRFVVHQLVDFGTATVSYNIIRNNVPMTQYPALNIALKVSAFATGYVVGSMMTEKYVRPQTDIELDKLFDLINHHTK